MLATASRSPAASYTFTNVADTSGPYSSFNIQPSINDSNQVVFKATIGRRRERFVKGTNPATDTIIDSTNPNYSIDRTGRSNNSGIVIFNATRRPQRKAISRDKPGH